MIRACRGCCSSDRIIQVLGHVILSLNAIARTVAQQIGTPVLTSCSIVKRVWWSQSPCVSVIWRKKQEGNTRRARCRFRASWATDLDWKWDVCTSISFDGDRSSMSPPGLCMLITVVTDTSSDIFCTANQSNNAEWFINCFFILWTD